MMGDAEAMARQEKQLTAYHFYTLGKEKYAFTQVLAGCWSTHVPAGRLSDRDYLPLARDTVLQFSKVCRSIPLPDFVIESILEPIRELPAALDNWVNYGQRRAALDLCRSHQEAYQRLLRRLTEKAQTNQPSGQRFREDAAVPQRSQNGVSVSLMDSKGWEPFVLNSILQTLLDGLMHKLGSVAQHAWEFGWTRAEIREAVKRGGILHAVGNSESQLGNAVLVRADDDYNPDEFDAPAYLYRNMRRLATELGIDLGGHTPDEETYNQLWCEYDPVARKNSYTDWTLLAIDLDEGPIKKHLSSLAAATRELRTLASLELPKRAREAYRSYRHAIEKMEEHKPGLDLAALKDRQVYRWLKELGTHNEDYDDRLPCFETWSRYLREARRSLGESKKTSGGAVAGRSIARLKHLHLPSGNR